ncbi:D-alanyl-D-alanine carboxypeptidase family protein [Bacillus sp. 1P06AnD]|uniref:D-alanyl-D-alanine carboxypeptidase family protein n=1 Tax=Bacillus sp. 1P06AnD TaxID=3132208 RepID=UPI0039A034CF
MKSKLLVVFMALLLIFIAFPNVRTALIGKIDGWGRQNDTEKTEEISGVMGSSVTIDRVHITGEAAVLMDEKTGQILFAKNENKRLYPASTTKIMTALIALEKGNPEDKVTVGNEVELKEKGESTAFLYEGQVITLEQLLQGLMLPSGNDAARTISIYIARKVSGNERMSDKTAMAYFVRLMNVRAEKLGAKNTHFVNPNGLHSPNHYSTASDLAKIARAAMKRSDFQQIVGQDVYKDRAVTYRNTNELLNPDSDYYYQGANGIKTGYTDEAGSCLVSSARHGANRLMAVVLKSTKKDIWKDSISLLDNGFAKVLASK